MIKLIIGGAIFIVSVLTLSCAPKPTDLAKATIITDEIYREIAPQVTTALQTSTENSAEYKRLRLVEQKLHEYNEARNKCVEAVGIWESTGQPPEDTRKHYDQMKKSIIDAVVLAQSLYIYTNECSARTAIKGKAGNSCR